LNVAANERFEIVGRYALYGEIASGSVATVCFGRLLGAVGLARPVAVKCLAPHLARDPRVRAVYMEEARRASRVRHPNVVPTLDVVAADGELLIVMDYVHGETLARLARTSRERRQPVPLRIALAIASNVLCGLQAAHEATSERGAPMPIVHRDLSPENVIVGVDGVARVLDLGLGRASERTAASHDEGGPRKLAYIAPEQLAEAPVTPATDIYAAGVVLWELLAGRRLFVRDDRTPSVLLDKLMHGRIEAPSTHAPSLPAALDAIVLSALGRRPSSRFGSARAMASAIEAVCDVATAREVGDWVERSASDALRVRSIALAALDSTPSRPRAASAPTYEVDVLLDELLVESMHESVDDGPMSSDPPPMIAASDTYPVTEPRTLRFVRAAPSPAVVVAPRSHGVRWTAVAGVLLAAFAGVAGGHVLTSSVDRNAAGPALAPRSSPIAAVVPAPPPIVCPADMVAVSASSFAMGDDDGLPFERPAHVVRLAAFCIDRLETTTADFRACSDRGDCKRASTTNDWSGITDRDRRLFDPLCNARDPLARAAHPMNCVDWAAASQACRARGARLPTEAEWELAARGVDGRKYPWGDREPNASLLNACGTECVAWAKKSGVDFAAMFSGDDGFATTAPVGSFPAGASRAGVEDLAGNVSEWVADFFGDYPSDERKNPTGPRTGSERIVRGGAWSGSLAAGARPTFRTKDAPSKRSYAIGFRCASSP
jgi:formylglycine-generating enzyme required for sulfatase activity/serine/threonine protein kinase